MYLSCLIFYHLERKFQVGRCSTVNWRGKHRVRLEARTALRMALCLEPPLEKRPGLHGASGHWSGSFPVTYCVLAPPSSFPSPGPSEPLVFRCLGFWPQSPSGAPAGAVYPAS